MQGRRFVYHLTSILLCAVLLLALVPGALAEDPTAGDLPLIEETEVAAEPLAAGRVRFTGVVEAVPSGGTAGDWTVAGLTVHVSATTVIVRPDDSAELNPVGKWATVEGAEREDESIDAVRVRIALPYAHLTGPVLEIPPDRTGTWNIAGQKILVDEDTRFAERARKIVVGTWVDVLALEREAGLWAARIIAMNATPTTGPQTVQRKVTASGAVQRTGLDYWTLSTMKIDCTRSTVFTGPQRLGLIADAVGRMSNDGRFVAERIVVRWEEGSGPVGHLLQFEGAIQTLPDARIGNWVIAGRTVHVGENTRIDETKGPAAVGAIVWVTAWVTPTTSTEQPPEALLIVVMRSETGTEFTGVVQQRPRPPMRSGIWKIGDRWVLVTPATVFDETAGRAIAGATVKVIGKVYNQWAGWVADKIVVMTATTSG